MKKLSLYVILVLMFCNIGFAEQIKFYNCAGKKDNFIFNPNKWEKYEILIDTYEKTVSSIMVRSDEMMKKEKYTKKNFIFGPDKLDSIIGGYAVRKFRNTLGKVVVEVIYDLEKKTRETTEFDEGGEVSLTKCK